MVSARERADDVRDTKRAGAAAPSSSPSSSASSASSLSRGRGPGPAAASPGNVAETMWSCGSRAFCAFSTSRPASESELSSDARDAARSTCSSSPSPSPSPWAFFSGSADMVEWGSPAEVRLRVPGRFPRNFFSHLRHAPLVAKRNHRRSAAKKEPALSLKCVREKGRGEGERERLVRAADLRLAEASTRPPGGWARRAASEAS